MKSTNRKAKLMAKGAISAFNATGKGLETRDSDNIEASWYNVGVFFKRSIDKLSIATKQQHRYSREELETY